MAELAAPAVRDWDFPRSAASVALISRFGAERGLGVDAMLRGTALDPARLRDPELQVDARQELAVVRNLVRAVGERADSTALDLGCRYRVTTFGIFGFACVSSPTLRDAMTFALRYLDLSFTFCIPRVAVEGDVITLTMHDDKVPGDVARFLVLRDLSAIVTVLRDLLPAIELRTLTFRHPTPSTTDSYHKVFRIVPVFSAPSCATTIDAGFLGHPLPQANEHTVAICEAQCRAMVTRRRRRSGIAHEVRERLIRVGGVDSGMDEVARWLAMSPRTLRRRLTEAGTSYRGLVDEVRQTLAEEMLATGALSVEDVAVRLGYAEASSFIYAFKRWTGTTPAAFARRPAR
ncbi:AraC family transcriptional regulator [Amycolatopsis sp. CA-230715]|uniref:AraC family transcriptional regulator n=1 Tax=Amycolatopsis sp. CA-230715 TaxID=2745196 RepID=UPI001C01E547|nr:AraC family transcriptional regulator [Amycolatopsis sp. CA-230715]QWF78374.1 putative HTH-type transcriptional regulator [Amycolatopsis sp. CA-230715]